MVIMVVICDGGRNAGNSHFSSSNGSTKCSVSDGSSSNGIVFNAVLKEAVVLMVTIEWWYA